MNYTERYHLPQWEETDRIMRTDFNQMCADIDEGITQAQETANTALELPYLIGTYKGNTANFAFVEVPFKPQAILIAGQTEATMEGSGQASCFFFTQSVQEVFLLQPNGFSLLGLGNLKRPGHTYAYIAFR